jgi:hypothetical protein
MPGQGTLRRLREREDQQSEPSSVKRLVAAILAAMRARNVVTGLAIPIVASMAVGLAVVVVAGANSGTGGPSPSSLSTGFPPATAANADFTNTAALTGRGISAPLGQVATFGSTVVAVGSQSGTRISRARFFVSSDVGRTWQLGAVQGNPPPGRAAALVAGGPSGWVAVGPDSVWTSPNGQDWLFRAALPQLAGDKITTLTSTASGFLAAGQNIPDGNLAKASPVVWVSSNGVTWQRLSVTQLGLAAGTGRVLGITNVAANGGVIVMSGTVAGAGTATSSGAWRSTDGGTSWTAVTVPAGNGASGTIAGLAPFRTGFIAVRQADVGGLIGAAAYTSGNGTAWTQGGTFHSANGAPLTLGPVSGGPNGAVVTAQADGFVIAFLSADGVKWTGTDPVATSAAEQVSGAVLTSSGQAMIAGTSAGDPAQRQPMLTLIGAQGGPDQINVRAIPGAIMPQVAVNAVAASAADQVAAGSADGLPAIWTSTDGGSTWARASVPTSGTLNQGGNEQLTGVTHGTAGWAAVGGATTTGQQPVVVGSAGGQTWEADGGATFTQPGLVTSSVAAGSAGYVIVGRQSSGGHTIAAAWSAPGLTGWQRAGDAQAGALDGAGNRQMDAVAATMKGFVAVGTAGTHPAAWLSAKGQTWSLVTLQLPASATSAELRYVAAGGDEVAAAGTEITAAGKQRPFAAVSADGGTTWDETTLPPPPGAAAASTMSVTALAAAGGGFTATGTLSTGGNTDVVVWMLPRGAAPTTTWTAAAPTGTDLSGPGTQAITALTNAGSTLTGIGFTATPASEEPTIWQSPVRS